MRGLAQVNHNEIASSGTPLEFLEQESASVLERVQFLVASAKELADRANRVEGFVVAAANFELAQAFHWFVASPGG
jgi:hypothetical protein